MVCSQVSKAILPYRHPFIVDCWDAFNAQGLWAQLIPSFQVSLKVRSFELVSMVCTIFVVWMESCPHHQPSTGSRAQWGCSCSSWLHSSQHSHLIISVWRCSAASSQAVYHWFSVLEILSSSRGENKQTKYPKQQQQKPNMQWFF